MVAFKYKTAEAPLRVDYDRRADVLYVSLGTPRAAEGEGRARGVELRYAMSGGKPCGVTVIGLKSHHWLSNLAELSNIIATHLSLPRPSVLAAIKASL